MNRIFKKYIKARLVGVLLLTALLSRTGSVDAAWTRSGNTITDANGWVLKVSDKTINGVSGLSLSSDAVSTKGTPTGVLDLSGAISDGSVIVELNDYALRSSSAGTLCSVTLPETAIRLGVSLFSGQSSLTNVAPLLPASVKIVGGGAFYNSPIQGALDISSVTNIIGPNAFRSTAITSAVCGAGLATIPSYTFDNCSKLASVQLQDGLARIERNAFSNCKSLKTITPFLPATVAAIDVSAFSGSPCTGVVSVVSSAFTTVAYQSWYGTKINGIILGAGVASIEDYAFQSVGSSSRAWDIRFCGSLPTFAGSRGTVFNSTSDWKLRVFFPAYDDLPGSWLDWIASNATPLTATELATYTNTWPGATLPVARGNDGTIFAKEYLVPWNPMEETGGLLIQGYPEAAGNVVPAYGLAPTVPNGGQIVCTAAPSTNAGVIHVCVGHIVERFDGANWGTPVTNASATFVHTQNGTEQTRLTWLWTRDRYLLSGLAADAFSADLGTVSRSVQPDSSGYYAAGAQVVLTAISQDGVFRRWLGSGVPADHAQDNPLTLVMDQPRAITPLFEHDWIYTPGSPATITDGYWTLKVSGDEELAISIDATQCDAPTCSINELDLRKPIEGGRALTAIDAYAFRRSTCREIAVLSLPDTLCTIGGNAFNGQSGLAVIEPALPASVVSVGGNAFSGVPYAGTLELTNPGYTTVSGQFFGLAACITNYVFGRGVTNIENYALDHWSSGSVAYDVFFSGDVPTFGASIIRGTPAYNCRFFVPRGHADWDAWIATNVTPLTQAENDAYAAAHPGERLPAGSWTPSGCNKQYVVTWTPPGDRIKTTVLILR